MSTLVYVHGTNGSGKSTLARAVIAAGGVAQNGVFAVMPHPRAWTTILRNPNVVLAGRYGSSCGGVDGIQPYADIHAIFHRHGLQFKQNVFAEGLVTPGLDTCQQFTTYFDKTVFILLETPDTVCIRNVLRRRAAKGNTKPYSPANLYKKAHSASLWAARLERAGLDVRRLQYKQARALTLQLLGLPEPTLKDLLS